MTAPQQQHEDPFGETRAQMVQALAVLATVGEAGARWATVGVQNRASKREQQQRAEQASAAAREHARELAQQADIEQDRAERADITKAFDTDWLEGADFPEAARLWRLATLHAAGGDQWARKAMTSVEARLRQLRPNLMDFYDRFRTDGRTPAEAMHAAAYAVWMSADDTNLGPHARPHPGRQPAGLRAGANGRAIGAGGAALDDLDAAVRREVADLADGVDPEALDRLQRQLRNDGLTPAADAAGLLAQYAHQLRADGLIPPTAADHLATKAQATKTQTGATASAVSSDAAQAANLAARAEQQRREATMAVGSPDIPATPVDEHRDGLTKSTVDHGKADRDLLRADQQRRMAQTFPQLTVVQANVPHLAGKLPAQTVPLRQIGRAR